MRQIASNDDGEWRSEDPKHEVVIRALQDSRIVVALDLLGNMESWPVPPAGNYQTQMEIMLQRGGDAARATLDRILYEVYELNTTHVWDLETDLWP